MGRYWTWMCHPAVQPLATHDRDAYDVLIIAVFERPGAARKRLLAAGVPDDKLLTLKGASVAPIAEGNANAAAGTSARSGGASK